MDVTELARLDRLTPALTAATGDERWREATAELISGGKSNLTFVITSAAGQMILRRPPTGDLLPSAHDMMREALVQQALAPTDVPVPRIVLADPGELIGTPCYVMERVPGHIIRDTLPPDYAITAADRTAMAHAFIDTLVALHSVDFERVGLGDYGPAYAVRPIGPSAPRYIWGLTAEVSRTRRFPMPFI